MVLYHVITIYHLLCAIVHRQVYYSDTRAEIVLPDFLKDAFPAKKCEELIKTGLFNQIFYYPYTKINNDSNSIVENAKSLLPQELHKNLKNYKDIIVFGAHFYFSLVLIDYKIPFIAAEEASGAFSRQEILEDALSISNPFHKQIAEQYSLLDYTSPYIIKTLCNYYAQQTEDYKNFNTENFDVMQCLGGLPHEMIQKICRLFDAGDLKLPPNSAVLLSQHFMNLNIMSYDEQIQLYKTFLDYFLAGKRVCIKPHPSDFMPYQYVLDHCTVLPRIFPTELIPFLAKEAMDTIATIYSTAMPQIKDYFKNVIELDMNYRESYLFTNQYYTALNFILANYSEEREIACIGTDVVQLRMLAKCNYSTMDRLPAFVEIGEKEASLPKIIIVDDIEKAGISRAGFQEMMDAAPQQCCFVFLNCKKDYCYYEYERKEIAEQMLPIVITVGNSEAVSEDVIYFYTKCHKDKARVREFTMDKELKHCEQTLSVKPMTEQEIQIKVLEGVLQATEQRLLFYIDLANKLSNKQKENE